MPKQDYAFWKTQPVVKQDETIQENGIIEPDRPLDQLQQHPYPLPKDFEWVILNLDTQVSFFPNDNSFDRFKKFMNYFP